MTLQLSSLFSLASQSARSVRVLTPLLVAVAGACASDDADGDGEPRPCQTDSLGSSVQSVAESSIDLEERLLVACVAIANLRAEPPLNVADTDTSVSCDAARDALQAEIVDGAKINDDDGACWLSIRQQEACEERCSPRCEPVGTRCEAEARKDGMCSTNLSESGCAATCSAGCGAMAAANAACDPMAVVVDAAHAPSVGSVLAKHLPTVRQVQAQSELLRPHPRSVFDAFEGLLLRPCTVTELGSETVEHLRNFANIEFTVDEPSHEIQW